VTADRGTVLFVVSGNWEAGLTFSYRRAFEALGFRTEQFHLEDARLAHVASTAPKVVLPLVSKFLGHIDLPAATQGANRALMILAMKLRPAIVVVSCGERVRPATLVQLKVSLPGTKVINIFPDTLFNMPEHLVQGLPLYDLFCTHTRAGIPYLEALGCRTAFYVPLAADPTLHHPRPLTDEARREYGCDVVYVGNWRPDHEALFSRLEGLDLAIWGSIQWERAKQGSWVKSRWRGRPLLTGEDYTLAHLAAKVCLNPIDPLNLPGHNQRLFELPACGVFSLVTRSEDATTIFREGETIACFDSPDELVEKIRYYLAKPDERARIAEAAHTLVMKGGHTYQDRVKAILARLGIEG
jgi:spore maturation protein CgeB